MTTVSPRSIITQSGDATGIISGLNHFQLIVNDMNASILFYRDVLGFPIKRSLGAGSLNTLAKSLSAIVGDFLPPATKEYFFDIGNGQLLILIELRDAEAPEESTYFPLWPDDSKPPTRPHKLDHLAFNVESMAELEWFQERLRSHGVATSEIVNPASGHFVRSIYFHDPSGTPLEIATFDRADERWLTYVEGEWLMDDEPMPATRPLDP